MSLTNSELIKRITISPEDVSLTLFNEHNESVPAGEITTLIRNKDVAKVRFTIPKLSNVRPLTYVMLHEGQSVLNVRAIKPIDNSAVGSEVELTYNL